MNSSAGGKGSGPIYETQDNNDPERSGMDEDIGAFVADRRPRGAHAQRTHDDVVYSGSTSVAFTSSDAKARSGNYIISFGFPGSGKSTFHSFMLRYLQREGDFDAQLSFPRGTRTPSYSMQSLVNSWRETWTYNTFVPRTRTLETDIREIRYDVTPLKGVRQPLSFGFVEVSGELLEAVQGKRNQAPKLPGAIHDLIGNGDVSPILLFMVDPENPENDDLFENLVTYIEQNFPHRRRSMSIGVIVAKPQIALEQMKKRDPGYAMETRLHGKLIYEYLRMYAKGTHRQYQAWPEERKMYTTLYLGEIGERNGPDGIAEKYLKTTDFSDISKIFGWIYTRFTGKKLGPTRIQRVLKNLRRKP